MVCSFFCLLSAAWNSIFISNSSEVGLVGQDWKASPSSTCKGTILQLDAWLPCVGICSNGQCPWHWRPSHKHCFIFRSSCFSPSLATVCIFSLDELFLPSSFLFLLLPPCYLSHWFRVRIRLGVVDEVVSRPLCCRHVVGVRTSARRDGAGTRRRPSASAVPLRNERMEEPNVLSCARVPRRHPLWHRGHGVVRRAVRQSAARRHLWRGASVGGVLETVRRQQHRLR